MVVSRFVPVAKHRAMSKACNVHKLGCQKLKATQNEGFNSMYTSKYALVGRSYYRILDYIHVLTKYFIQFWLINSSNR